MLTNPKIVLMVKNMREKYKDSEIISVSDVPANYLELLRSDAALEGSVIGTIDGHELREGYLEIRGFMYVLMQWNEQETVLGLWSKVK